MESLKKFISLSEAAKISGYTQDYLGSLIRKGEMKGTKKGNTWFTTEEEIKNYLFKKKVRNSELAIPEFFSASRSRKIIIATVIIFVGGFLLLSYINKNKTNSVEEVRSAVTSDGEGVIINN